MTEREESALWRELEDLRVQNARLGRRLEDLLYNLDGENMPSVDARICALEEKLARLASGSEG